VVFFCRFWIWSTVACGSQNRISSVGGPFLAPSPSFGRPLGRSLSRRARRAARGCDLLISLWWDDALVRLPALQNQAPSWGVQLSCLPKKNISFQLELSNISRIWQQGPTDLAYQASPTVHHQTQSAWHQKRHPQHSPLSPSLPPSRPSPPKSKTTSFLTLQSAKRESAARLSSPLQTSSSSSSAQPLIPCPISGRYQAGRATPTRPS